MEPDDPVLDLLGVGRKDRLFCTEDAGESILLVLLWKKMYNTAKTSFGKQ